MAGKCIIDDAVHPDQHTVQVLMCRHMLGLARCALVGAEKNQV